MKDHRRHLTNALAPESLWRAAVFALWLERHFDLSKERVMEIATMAARRGLLTAKGRLRQGARVPGVG